MRKNIFAIMLSITLSPLFQKFSGNHFKIFANIHIVKRFKYVKCVHLYGQILPPSPKSSQGKQEKLLSSCLLGLPPKFSSSRIKFMNPLNCIVEILKAFFHPYISDELIEIYPSMLVRLTLSYQRIHFLFNQIFSH